MANSKIDRIDKEILKTREKISEYQNKLRSLEAQKAEAENLQIVQLVRAMHLTPRRAFRFARRRWNPRHCDSTRRR